MSDNNELLAAEELEFLLQQAEAQSTGEDMGNLEQTENARVTIRGDLDKINLADIFQTLAMAKMEGILRVRNALESREIFFHGGQVRYRFPARSETKRLGQRLIRSRMISSDQLRMALLVQKKDSKPLGQILIGHEYVTEDDLERIANQQLQEDLFDLFTWKRGFFEFYKGAPKDPILIERFDQAPEFDVSSVLLEVARRSDEWELILETLHSIDEIPVLLGDLDPADFQGDQAAVIEVIDGEQSLRELAETSVLGLFDCSRAVLDLFNAGYVQMADADHLLSVAEDSVDSGNVKRALLTMQTLQERDGELDMEMVESMADILQRCGEPKLAARTLIGCAERLTDADERVKVALRAREMDHLSVEVLRFLYTQLLETGATQGQEFMEVASDLAEALSEKGAHDEALKVIEEAEKVQPSAAVVLTRKARILHKSDKSAAAIDVLLKLAEGHKAAGDKTRLTGVYEQILKIDSKRRDVQKALRDLKSSKSKRLTKKIILAGAGVLLAVFGAFYVDALNTDAKIRSVRERVQDKLLVQDTKGAAAIVRQAVQELGTHPELDALRTSINRMIKNNKKARGDKARQEIEERVGKAREGVAVGNIRKALDTFAELMKDRRVAVQVKQMAAVALKELLPIMKGHSDQLEQVMPEEPNQLQKDAERQHIIKTLSNRLQLINEAVVNGLVENRENPTLKAILGEIGARQLLTAASKLSAQVAQAKERLEEYIQAQRKVTRQREMSPIWEAALKAEHQYEFRRARDLYKQLLVQEHGPTLKATFKDKVIKYSNIVKSIKTLEEFNANGNSKGAQGIYRTLIRSYPEIPFERLVTLPVQIVSMPPGATVRLDDTAVGKTPLWVRYYPGVKTKVRVERRGFYTERTTITDVLPTALIRAPMSKRPDCTFKTEGVLQHPPVEDGRGHAYLVDRNGVVYGLDIRNNRRLWSTPTGDLSGLLTRPLLHGNKLVVGSVDGPLRMIDVQTGKVAWTKDGMNCEARPALSGTTLVIATSKKKLYSLDLETKAMLEMLGQGLPAQVRADLGAVRRDVVIVADDGQILCVNPKRGQMAWGERIAPGIPTEPFFTAKHMFLGTDEGVLECRDLKTGRTVWRQTGLGEIHHVPCVSEDSVYVASSEKLVKLQRRNGKIQNAYKTGQRLSCAPAVHDGRLYVGCRPTKKTDTGRILVFDVKTMKLQYLIRGRGAAKAILFLRDGTGIAVFENKQVQVFRQP